MTVSPIAICLQYMNIFFLFLPFCFFLPTRKMEVFPTKGNKIFLFMSLNKRAAFSALEWYCFVHVYIQSFMYIIQPTILFSWCIFWFSLALWLVVQWYLPPGAEKTLITFWAAENSSTSWSSSICYTLSAHAKGMLCVANISDSL